jgi:FkbM family methyltransferase
MMENLPRSLEEFKKMILCDSIQSLKLNTFLDNYDAEVFDSDGVDRSLIFNTQERFFYFEWFFNYFQRLYGTYLRLSNSESRYLYLQLICYRLAGHHSIKIPLEYSTDSEEYKNYMNIEGSGSPSTLDVSGMFGKLKHFDFEYKGNKYIADSFGFDAYLFKKQYFYSKDDAIVSPNKGDFIIDGGACTGDTALVFSNAVGQHGKVFSFDPVKEHIEILNHNISQYPLKNVVVMPYGLSNEIKDFPPISLNGYSPGFRVDFNELPLRTIDYLVEKGDIERIDFIKLDVEGSEINALDGALNSIKFFKPKLAISLYHKANDIFEIIEHISFRFPFYTHYYIGHYSIQTGETVLYVSI